ncbi:MAG TPA: hypothetical protein PKI59_04305, partial [Candidatus Cloacimonadota bacterium]|nr:hypothetical protein [Candidatus Cloacimonadota bacterium]
MKLLPYGLSKSLICMLFAAIGYGIGIRKRVAKTQMQKVNPSWSDSKIQTTMKAMYRHMALNIAEIYLMSDTRLDRRSKVIGMEHI